MLEQQNYETPTSTSRARRAGFRCEIAADAIILDYQMPEINGGAVARPRKQIRPHVPILLTSVYERLVLTRSVDAFVSKSETRATLLAD